MLQFDQAAITENAGTSGGTTSQTSDGQNNANILQQITVALDQAAVAGNLHELRHQILKVLVDHEEVNFDKVKFCLDSKKLIPFYF